MNFRAARCRALAEIALACVVFASCSSHATPTPVATGTARFDWFQYEGNDSVYRAARPGPNDYLNPIIAGFYPDPTIIRAGTDYYAAMSSFAYFPGVPIFHSKDLVNWTQIGHVLDRPSQLNVDSAGVSRGIFAPALNYRNGVFYMITTLIDRGGNFYVTATDPKGPWSDPIWLKVDGIDPSFFFDDDGKAYIVNNGPPEGTPLYEGHRAIWMQEYDLTARTIVGTPHVIVNGGVDLSKKPIWIEAPHIFKRNGTYYLICAEGGTGPQHSEVVFRSASVQGPYVAYSGNPILTQRHLDPARPFPVETAGHADFVETPNGEWWAVFLGTRNYGRELFNTGRETFMLPVRWTSDGWPVMLTGRDTVPYVNVGPKLTRTVKAAVPHSGNFALRDEFNSTTLASYWTMLRTPHERWFDLASSPGSLVLRARPEELSGRGQPSLMMRRQQHGTASATTAMTYMPAAEGDRAGLVAFHNEDHYYFLGVVHDGTRRVIQLRRRSGRGVQGDSVLASAPLALEANRPLFLEIRAREGRYDFRYATEPNAWETLMADADGTVLSTRVAGGFVGTMFGMYAYSAK